MRVDARSIEIGFAGRDSRDTILTGLFRVVAANPRKVGVMKKGSTILRFGFVLGVAFSVGCGDGTSGGGAPGEPSEPNEPPQGCEEGPTYDGTWAALQDRLIERYECRDCHNPENAFGNLDLSPEVAYQNLIEVDSSYRNQRVVPGNKWASNLYMKVACGADPDLDGCADNGPYMPSNRAPVDADTVELLGAWIYGGAPERGLVLGTEELIEGCLPELEPYSIKPLEVPEPGAGIQFVMPTWTLEKSSEHEGCFMTYYDFCADVPDDIKTPDGREFRFKGHELRQDALSHHMLTSYVDPATIDPYDPGFGEWVCAGGSDAGKSCDPFDLEGCSGGACRTPFVDGFACFNFGPPPGLGFLRTRGLPLGAQSAQAKVDLPEGVYTTMPCSGFMIYNPHAFNLTTKDHDMNARINVYFADENHATYPVRSIFDIDAIFSPTAPPFEKREICSETVLPRYAQIIDLSSHTHAKGELWITYDPQGNEIYRNEVYNDPPNKRFEPRLVFDSADPRDRTLRHCVIYNNGVNDDGSPNVETVTRYSRLPQSVFLPGVPGRCSPTACVNDGAVGRPCSGLGDDATCDTEIGGDGWCDACPITGGESTMNEMFLPLGRYVIITPVEK
jgi:hypothetical protein